MNVILDLQGFRRVIEVDRTMPEFYMAWHEQWRLENSQLNYVLGARSRAPKIRFLASGKTVDGLPLYEWDGENLFWGDRHPYSARPMEGGE